MFLKVHKLYVISDPPSSLKLYEKSVDFSGIFAAKIAWYYFTTQLKMMPVYEN